MKKALTLFCLIFFFSNASAQKVSGDTLIADFKYLVKALEETHPDPYSGFGGKVFFHKKAFDIEQVLAKGMTLNEFAQISLAFISNLEDGHTYINQKQSNVNASANLMLPLETTVISEGLIVSKISKNNELFLGSKLLSVNGIPVMKLCNEAGKLSPSENIYGKYSWLSSAISNYNQMKRILPDMNKTIIVELENLKEEKQFIELAYTDKDEFSHISMVEVPNWSKIKDEFMYYDYLDDGKQAMYFRLSSIMTKEPFVFMKQNGWDNIDRMLDNVYTRYLKKPMPENMDEAIEALPGLVEMFSEMLEKMKSDNAKYLIIDLRKNTGGFTPITLPTLYMLYGDKYLVKDMDVNFYRLISPLLMKKYNMTLDDYNGKNSTNFQFGDYTFSTKDIDDIDINKRREQLINNAMGDAADYIRELNGKPLYTPPKIFVLIDVGTFSAAFHYTFYLWKMGATVVGIPSKQAPNTYMEGTFFELPLTTLSGSISNSFQAILPPNDRRAKIFYPDIMLSREKYETYKYDKQSELLYLIDILDLSL